MSTQPLAAPVNTPKRGGLRAMFRGLVDALQWRLLLMWMLGLLLPTAIVTLPVWRSLAAQLDHSLQVARIASGFDAMALTDALGNIGQHGAWFGGAGLGASAVALLLAPWLGGMVVASIRTGYPLGLAGLAGGGVREYGRMLRTLLWALVPLGVAIGLAGMALGFADRHTDGAILAAEVEQARDTALIVAAVLFVIAHASVEAGRGALAADPALRSAVRAWGRGVRLLLRRPLATLLVYLGTALVGYGLAGGLGVLRLQASGGGWADVLVGVVLTQLVVAAVAWGRGARLYAMADLARNDACRHPAKPKAAREAPQPRTPEASEAPEPVPAPVEATIA